MVESEANKETNNPAFTPNFHLDYYEGSSDKLLFVLMSSDAFGGNPTQLGLSRPHSHTHTLALILPHSHTPPTPPPPPPAPLAPTPCPP